MISVTFHNQTEIPDELTYPAIQPYLFEKVNEL